MILLEEFKRQLGITSLQMSKSTKTGRQFATVGTVLVMVSKQGLAKDKPIFVTTATTKQDEKCFVLCNSTLVAGETF